jgi:cytochrome P450
MLRVLLFSCTCSIALTDCSIAWLVGWLVGRLVQVTNGDKWKRQRRICAPAFHWQTVQGFVDQIGRSSNALLDLIQSNGGLSTDSVCNKLLSPDDLKAEGVTHTTVDVVRFMQKFTLDVLGKCVFSFDFGVLQREEGEYVRLYNSIIRDLFQPLRFIVPMFDKLPIDINERLDSNISRFIDILQSVIEERRKLLLQQKQEQAQTPERERQQLHLNQQSPSTTNTDDDDDDDDDDEHDEEQDLVVHYQEEEDNHQASQSTQSASIIASACAPSPSSNSQRQLDLLDMMLGNGDEANGMTDEELRHNMNTLFLAGYVSVFLCVCGRIRSTHVVVLLLLLLCCCCCCW